MAKITPAQAYAYLIAAGATPEEAVILTAVAGGESSYNTRAYNGKGKDRSYGLWQINMLGQMGVERAKAWGLSSYDQLFDPMTNARAAVSILRSQGLRAWTVYTSGAYKAYLPQAQQAAAAVGNNYQAYIGGGGAPASSGGGAPVASPPPKLAQGGTVVRINTGGGYVVYDLGHGIYVRYTIPYKGFDFNGSKDIGTVTQAQFNKMFPNYINGGNALELDSIAKDFGSYRNYWNWLIKAYMGPNPAKNDPGVLRVLAQLAARPDMSSEELDNLLKSTSYYQSRTEAQLEWNDLSKAEREKRVNDTAIQLVDSYFQLVGAQIPMTNGTLMQWARRIASGEIGYGVAIEQWIKPAALKNPESPWSRTIRNEKINQGQFEVDVENAAEQARQLARRWGVQLSETSLADWGNKLTMNEASEADLIDYLKKQASILYPWKDPELETMEAAEPWLQTYSRVMERNADIFNVDVQRALSQGQPVFEFEQTLRSSDQWLETRNATDTLTSMAAEIGRRMGFH